jgi:hypothetical protein
MEVEKLLTNSLNLDLARDLNILFDDILARETFIEDISRPKRASNEAAAVSQQVFQV